LANDASLASGLRDGRPGVSLAADTLVSVVNRELGNMDASGWGANVGSSLAAGLNSQYGVVRSAAGGLAAAVRGQIGIRSEPSDSDSPLHGLTQWGGNLVDAFAAGINHQLSVARRASSALGAALRPSMGPLGLAGYGSTVAAPGGGYGARLSQQPAVVYVQLDGRTLAKAFIPELTREQRRQGLS